MAPKSREVRDARAVLLAALTKDEQRDAIEWMQEWRPVTEAEVMALIIDDHSAPMPARSFREVQMSYEKARRLVANYSSRIGAAHVERALIEEIATEIALAELRSIPHRSEIADILRDHFWTGEPGQIEAIELAAKAFAKLFQQSRGGST
jgi:hypothetical protein